jgi:hypothetical protein
MAVHCRSLLAFGVLKPVRPPDSDLLRWLAPAGSGPDEFAATRPLFEQWLSRSPGKAVYSVNTRSIYRIDDDTNGPIAIKELRFESAAGRLRATTIRRHRVLCEFRAQAAFHARGGNTPRLFGAALEFNRGLITRVFILMSWIDSARTMSIDVGDLGDDERDAAFKQYAQFFVRSAQLGLVHGRHSSENILVTDGKRDFYVIDFSHAQLYRAYHPLGFARDVARIGARLVIEESCSAAAVRLLFSHVVRAAPRSTVTEAVLRKEFNHVLSASKRQQKILRQMRTLWRGWPFRLHQ